MSGSELDWNDLALLMAVCRAGSLSGAARELGNNHSTVLRRVNAIEERTGVRFFERLPNRYKMTAAGEIALRYAERVESEFLALGREVLGAAPPTPPSPAVPAVSAHPSTRASAHTVHRDFMGHLQAMR